MSEILIWEQSDWSLVYPSWDIITPEKRELIISNSLSTPVRQDENNIKDVILNSVASILIWETWSWKTTELQQMIHEVYPEDLVITNIPLVWSAIWTACYVSDIMYAKTGNPYYILGNWGIWYRTWKWSSEEKRTQLTNNTFWLDYLNLSLWNFERTLNTSKKNIHVILDEIHEKWEDFVFYLRKIIDLSKKYPWRIKLYWASATVSDTYLDLILNKFGVLSSDIPVVKVDWRTFPIETIEENWADTIKKIVELYEKWKSILAFQPWKSEINKTIATLQERLWNDIKIFPFHAEISSEELKANLEHTWEQKIFVATNAARTWITLDINGVVDLWLEKNQYFNEFWIPVLLSESITQDAYHQNKWRAWRKSPGISIYTWKSKILDLKEEAPSSVEIKIDEKKILMELLSWENILKNEKNKKHSYLFNLNKRTLKLSYDWMKKAWLVTKDEKITKHWLDVLKLPLNVFNWRILLEAIDNWVATDVIPMVTIIENNGFIKKEFDLKKFPKSFFDKWCSDLDIYNKLFDILSSTKIDDHVLNIFCNMWIPRALIEYFKALDWEKKFYDVVKEWLEEIWFKYKNIKKIDETIEKIYKTISNNSEYSEIKDIEVSDEEKQNLIAKSLLSGNLHNIYNVCWTKKLKDHYDNQKWLIFEQSDTSYAELEDRSTYIWVPFILWWSSDRDDLNILSFLTKIDTSDIEYFENLYSKAYVLKKKELKVETFSIDNEWDTFSTPYNCVSLDKRKKYLSLNWLPYFLINKNKYFKNFISSQWDDYDKDIFIKLLKKITKKQSSRIDPNNKEKCIDTFLYDNEVLELFIKSWDREIQSFLLWEKIEKSNSNEHIEQNEIIDKSDFFEYVKVVSEYNKVLAEWRKYVSKNNLNTSKIVNYILNNIISSLEDNSTNYSKLIIFLKKINQDKSNHSLKREIKKEFKSFDLKWRELLKIKKRNSWVMSFISNLNDLIKGKDVSIKWLSDWITDNNKLLLSDPIIKKNSIWTESILLNKEFKDIRKFFSRIDLDDKVSNKLIWTLQRLLFSDRRKFNRWLKGLDIIIIDLKSDIQNNNEKIISLKKVNWNNSIEENNREKKKINILNDNINKFIKKLLQFKDNITDLNEKISKIDFEDIIFSSNFIYTKDFLYNILIDTIFDWKIVDLDDCKQELQLKDKLNTYLKWDKIDIDVLIELIKNYISLDWNNKWRKDIELKITNISKDIWKIVSLYKEEKEELTESFNWEEFEKVTYLIESLEWLLLELYPEKIVKLYNNRILHFAKTFHSLSIWNVDNKLKDFLLKFWWSSFKSYWDEFTLLDEYNELYSEINWFESIDINTYRNNWELEENNNFVGYTEIIKWKTKSFKNKVSKINSIRKSLVDVK